LWSTLKAPGQSILEVGRERALREEGGFSYRNAVIAEVDGEVAAALIGYRLDDPYELGDLGDVPEIVRPLVKLEAKAPGSWYVNVLATFPEFRRQGLGLKLLEHAGRQALRMGAPALSVIVADWNAAAKRLYDRAGYEQAASSPVFLYPGCPYEGHWVLMIKTLRP
jgi:ribosomal protein S18 acetylase RimI-like enzyme